MLKKIVFTAIFGLAIFVYFAEFSYSQNTEVIEASPATVISAVQQTLAAVKSTKKDDKPKPIKEVLPDAEKIDGLITLYRKKEQLFAEIKSSNLNTDYLIAIAVAKGSGSSVIGGFTLGGAGEDKLWQFRKVGDRIHVVRRNIKFKANPGTPEELAVDVAYSDNTVYSLPIVAAGDNGGDVIDFGSIFMSDLAGVGMYLGSFSRDKSYWGTIKGFTNNIEFRVVATYSGGGLYRRLFGTGSEDQETSTVTIHYSISKLPSSGYTARLADNRIGYFTTSHKNYSKNPNDNHYVRYINRWNLQKADPTAKLSPPKKPIIFWISKTTPFRYRNAVRDGILEWNKAFEKVGIVNAIEVRHQTDTDTWDAEDINYNTFRWITSSANFAMGPSHVNPITGEILDADIIFDAGFVESWRSTFNKFIGDVIPPDIKNSSNNELKNLLLKKSSKSNGNKIPNDITAVLNSHGDSNLHNIMHGMQSDINSNTNGESNHNLHECSIKNCTCSYSHDRASQFALASLLFVLSDEDDDTIILGENNNDDSDEDSDEDSNEDSNDDSNENDINENNVVTENTSGDDDNDKENDKEKEAKKEEPKKEKSEKEKSEKGDEKGDSENAKPKKGEPKKGESKKGDSKKSVAKKDAKDNKKESDKPNRVELQKKLDEAFERFVLEGLKDVVMHEVGHTLGLRHNFKASSWLTLDEINDPKRSKEYGIAGSVMDYLPVNISPKGKHQGDYFMTTLGPYDYLAIEYGYKVLSGGTEGETKELRAIAAKQAEKGNNYAPDEDAFLHDDPLTIRRDLGRKPIDYAKSATELYNQLLPQVLNRAVKEGESYKDVSGFYLSILVRRLSADYYLARNVGGQYRNRDWRGDPGKRSPIQPVDAKTQRESVDFLCKTLLTSGSFSIPPDLYNKFGEEIWLENRAYGSSNTLALDIRELFFDVRAQILVTLVSPDTLNRINDSQFRVGGKSEIYTIDELFESLSKSIFKELDTIGEGTFTNKKPAIDIQQRDLQFLYFMILSTYSINSINSTSDLSISRTNARPITKNQLIVLEEKITKILEGKAKLDLGSKLYLEDLKSRINKVLDPVLQISAP
ncbi:MAG: zinc-dependent metalloprotease [Planctomycetaceae bacterium]|jgi:hypothetical protein|nr:zinc-dependent metalloprotease [Planctomycetaceae bacterium]